MAEVAAKRYLVTPGQTGCERYFSASTAGFLRQPSFLPSIDKSTESDSNFFAAERRRSYAHTALYQMQRRAFGGYSVLWRAIGGFGAPTG